MEIVSYEQLRDPRDFFELMEASFGEVAVPEHPGLLKRHDERRKHEFGFGLYRGRTLASFIGIAELTVAPAPARPSLRSASTTSRPTRPLPARASAVACSNSSTRSTGKPAAGSPFSTPATRSSPVLSTVNSDTRRYRCPVRVLPVPCSSSRRRASAPNAIAPASPTWQSPKGSSPRPRPANMASWSVRAAGSFPVWDSGR